MQRCLSSIAPPLALLLLLVLSDAGHAAESSNADLGKRLFLSGATPPCAICHSLKDAGAEGAIGPSLDELKPDAARVMKAVRNGIGQMPAFSSLTDQQVEAIARYVEAATGATK
jgi:mono/diheme cytochrome c family protein